MANRIYNHKSRIKGSQPAIIKAVHPGMIIGFKYRKEKVFDVKPTLLVLYKDYSENLVHGLNLNYLAAFNMKLTINNLVKGASGQAIQTMNILYKFPEGLGLR